ncbi:hypothetical protein CERSUDRAFT_146637, partial [Gelatoporia subvermispora B]
MNDPQSHSRVSSINPSSVYTFSHIFPSDTQQSEFFTRTTLPLVRDVLEGQNGLLFAYGVTNSGKTYTIQGGNTPGSAGILPRTLDVIFNNPTVLKLDRNHEYTVWLSYAEVYNEKVYDLFASVDDCNSVAASPARAGKYIAGLRQIRVRSAAQAKALLKLGQLHRRVFGTVANSQSSRSHALVTIKILRVHRGERTDPASIQTSRLTLVDLAGSERNKHTQTSGDRLREAGNINKSLMVLGQCMETLRVNQRAVARSLAVSGERVDTRDVKKALAIVPFRHSKLTEVLMDYFVGEGRAVMIVNVNPYDTGFDENSHVMKFAALARDVRTNPVVNAPRAVATLPKAKPNLSAARYKEVVPHRRKVTISTGGPGRKVSEAQLEVLEEDEERGDDDDEEPVDPLVDTLFDEIESLRAQLFQAELQCAIVEAET